MIKNNLYLGLHLMVSFVFIGTLSNFNFSILGLPEYLTSVRLVVILSIILLFLHLFKNKGKFNCSILNDRLVILGLFSVLIISLSLSISYLINNRTSSITPVVSAWMQAYLYVSFCILLSSLNKFYFIRSFNTVIVFYVLFFMLFLYLSIDGVGLWEVRAQLNESLPQGLNRFVNGYLFLFVIPLALCTKGIEHNKLTIFAALLTLFLGLWLLAYSGSRQYVVGLLLLIFTVYFYTKNKFTLTIFLGILGFLIFLMSIKYISDFDILVEQLSRRMLEQSTESLESGSDRFDRYKAALELFYENWFFGLGPSAFVNLTGLYPDSGVLQYLVESGILFFFILYILLLLIVATFFSNKDQYSEISTIIFIYFLITIFFQNFFNELFLSYFVWLLLPLIRFLKDYNPIRD